MALKKSAATEVIDVNTGEVMPATSIKAVDTMDATEFFKWAQTEGIEVVEFDGGGNWDLVGNKDDLIDVPFVIPMLRWTDKTNSEGVDVKFVSVCAYKEDGTKIVFNDGSTGIYNQLQNYVAKNKRDTNIMCRKGLRKSDYTYIDPITNKKTPATTYYIA